MKLTAGELARIEAMTTDRAPPPAPAGMPDETTTLAMLLHHRRVRLARR